LRFIKWLREKFNPFNSALEVGETMNAHSQMGGNGSAHSNFTVVVGDVKNNLKGHIGDAVENPEVRDAIEIDHGRISARGIKQWREDWRVGQGFIGQDGIPRIWETSKQCWLPLSESSRAGGCATLKSDAPSA
jgi:hypothetical protein